MHLYVIPAGTPYRPGKLVDGKLTLRPEVVSRRAATLVDDAIVWDDIRAHNRRAQAARAATQPQPDAYAPTLRGLVPAPAELTAEEELLAREVPAGYMLFHLGFDVPGFTADHVILIRADYARMHGAA